MARAATGVHYRSFRRCSTVATSQTGKTTFYLEEKLAEEMKDERYKFKAHPGIRNMPRITMPQQIERAIKTLTEKYPINQLEENAEKMSQYLWSRKLPTQDDVVKSKAQAYEQEIIEKESLDFSQMTEEAREFHEKRIKSKILAKIKRHLYHWEPIRYDAFQSMVYLTARFAPEYSALCRVFKEIKMNEPDFKPLSLFDSGSGVGTTAWAANQTWPGSIKEHYLVDISPQMNTLARLLMQDGDEDKETMCFPGVFFRQFHPALDQLTYDLVVSSYSLMEQSTQDNRLEMISSLWKKTDQYLVIIENGTNAGFQAIMEARDKVLKEGNGYVVAPCPHDLRCPKTLDESKPTPCNFPVCYKPMMTKTKEAKMSERISYVVLKKGSRPDGSRWPRMVSEPKKRTRHVHCDLCCKDGNVTHLPVTRSKHGRELYRCVRTSEWGDLVPAIQTDQSESVTKSHDSDPVTTCTSEHNNTNFEHVEHVEVT